MVGETRNTSGAIRLVHRTDWLDSSSVFKVVHLITSDKCCLVGECPCVDRCNTLCAFVRMGSLYIYELCETLEAYVSLMICNRKAFLSIVLETHARTLCGLLINMTCTVHTKYKV